MRSGNKGFTLVELMVTLAVLAILVAVAMPSFRGAINRSQADTEVSDLMRGLNYARLEAINRGISTRIRPSTANAAWTTELAVMATSETNANPPRYYRVMPAMTSGAALNVTAGVTSLDFNNIGGVSAAATFNYVLGTENRTVNICLNGRVVLGSC